MATKMGSRISIISAAVAVVVLALAGLAWACTPSAHISASRVIGLPQSTVQVQGAEFNPGSPVEIRWNSPDGKILGTAAGPSFSVPVSVPEDAAPGVYYIVAVQRDLSAGQVIHGFSGKASATFEVTTGGDSKEGRGTAVGSDLWSGLSTSQGVEGLKAAEASGSTSAPNTGLLVAGAALFVTGLALVGAVVAGSRRKARTS